MDGVWTVKYGELEQEDRVTLYANREVAWVDFEAKALDLNEVFGIGSAMANDRGEAQITSGGDVLGLHCEQPRTKPLSQLTPQEAAEEALAETKEWKPVSPSELFPRAGMDDLGGR